MIPLNRSKNTVFRPLRGVAARCLLAAVPLAIAPAAHAGYKLTYVPDPTDTGLINLLGINDSMTIAGFDDATTNQGFTLTLPHSFTTVKYPGAASTQVTGINAAGDLSGFYVDAMGNNHGFTDIGGTFTTVDNPASTVFNQLLGINNSDETVGYYAPTPAGSPNDIAYSEKGGAFTDINTLLPTNFNSQAVGINSAGTPWIVGFYQPDAGLATSFGYPRRGRHDHHHRSLRIDLHPGARRQQPRARSSASTSTGRAHSTATSTRAASSPASIRTARPRRRSTGSTISAISSASTPTPRQTPSIGFVGTPVPEASTWAMLLAGFAGLGFLGYRKTLKGTAAAAA